MGGQENMLFSQEQPISRLTAGTGLGRSQTARLAQLLLLSSGSPAVTRPVPDRDPQRHFQVLFFLYLSPPFFAVCFQRPLVFSFVAPTPAAPSFQALSLRCFLCHSRGLCASAAVTPAADAVLAEPWSAAVLLQAQSGPSGCINPGGWRSFLLRPFLFFFPTAAVLIPPFIFLLSLHFGLVYIVRKLDLSLFFIWLIPYKRMFSEAGLGPEI